jgi:predicted N-acyltransferase
LGRGGGSPFLHFEVLLLQAYRFRPRPWLKRVEAGAQGAHKLARGYLPQATYSAHYIADPSFRRAIEAYLVEERREVAFTGEVLAERAPFRRGDPVDRGEPSWNPGGPDPGDEE